MGLIYLYLDHTHVLEPAPDRFLVEAISDYVPAYARIAEAMHADQPVTIVVRDPTCAAWLPRGRLAYPTTTTSAASTSQSPRT